MKEYCKEHLYKDFNNKEHDENSIKARFIERLERVKADIELSKKERIKPCIFELRR